MCTKRKLRMNRTIKHTVAFEIEKSENEKNVERVEYLGSNATTVWKVEAEVPQRVMKYVDNVTELH